MGGGLRSRNKWEFWWEKAGAGGGGEKAWFAVFFEGVWAAGWCWGWFFCGEIVVGCVVNVEKKLVLFVG